MRGNVEVHRLGSDHSMFDLLMLLALAASFAALGAFVHACDALTQRGAAEREGRQ